MAVVADGVGPPGLKDPKARLFKIGAYGGATVGDAGSVGLQAIWWSQARGQFESRRCYLGELERSVSVVMETTEAGEVMVRPGSVQLQSSTQ